MEKIMKKIIYTITALAIVTALTFTMVGCSSAPSDDQLNFAKTKVEDFSEWQARSNAEFYDEIYSKANMAALSFNPKMTDEQLADAARYLYAESIMVTDAEGKIIASTIKDKKGKNISDFDELVIFEGILKWVCPRCCKDVKKIEGTDEYEIMTGVQRVDDGGCVILDIITDEYSKVDGSKLADECGPNVTIAKEGVIVSTDFSDWKEGDKLKDHGVSDSDIKSGSFTIGEEKTNCSAATVGIYTVICGA